MQALQKVLECRSKGAPCMGYSIPWCDGVEPGTFQKLSVFHRRAHSLVICWRRFRQHASHQLIFGNKPVISGAPLHTILFRIFFLEGPRSVICAQWSSLLVGLGTHSREVTNSYRNNARQSSQYWASYIWNCCWIVPYIFNMIGPPTPIWWKSNT